MWYLIGLELRGSLFIQDQGTLEPTKQPTNKLTNLILSPQLVREFASRYKEIVLEDDMAKLTLERMRKLGKVRE